MKITDPFVRKEIGSCFYLAVPVFDKDLMNERFEAHSKVEQATKLFMNGTINGLDFCDLVEETGLDMDGYLEEVNQNIDSFLAGNVYLL